MARYRFAGPCEFDSTSGVVRCGDERTRLEPQPAALLALLADRAGDVVTHDEIRSVLWGDDTRVNCRKGVHDCVKQIRAALGDRGQAPRIVETVPRRGYRLRAEALLASPRAKRRSAGRQPEGSLRSRTPKWLAIACLGVSLGSACVRNFSFSLFLL